ncbi:ice-binding family protein [Neptunomonas antarctica]|uniref:PEP-CTERM protein-sorting domain-containing protein n=1 Tax=Neptunomonas antarctica TaxID=619304 RepID=A0A1N7IVY0_9GAMM|nr:ice-binding family protein [Neptunomonas antarctica]SIS41263.1 PEP-CTERM protein-sorting domain-containing protein [Neptunomonas antarctica]
MSNKWSKIFLCSILSINSSGAAAGLLLGPDLLGYSAVAGAAISIAADAVVDNNLGAVAAVAIGARTETANIYSGNAAVAIGANATTGNTYAGMAVSLGADASAANIYAGAATTVGANASADNIYSGAAITLGAGASAEDVYAAAAITNAGVVNSSSAGNTTTTTTAINSYQETLDLAKALEQIDSAQKSLFNIKKDYDVMTNLGSYNFDAGVYEGSALTIVAGSTITLDGLFEENPLWIFNLSAAMTVGANTTFEIINAGAGAGVIWNLGGALDLGAGTSFLGTAFVTGAVTGATSSVSCGSLFATAAIGIGSVTSTNCLGSETWAGSINGLSDGIQVIDSFAINSRSAAVSVPEPSTGFLMGAILIVLASVKSNRKNKC